MIPHWWYVSALCLLVAIAVAWKRPQSRWRVFGGALISIPLLFLPTIAEGHIALGSLPVFLKNTLLSFSLGAVASALYHLILQPIFSRPGNPTKHTLLVLLPGILVASIFYFLHLPLGLCLVLDCLTTIILACSLWGVVTWSAMASGFSFAMLYVALYYGLGLFISPLAPDFWFATFPSGVSLLSLPIGEIALVAIFGFSWGPLYSILPFRGDTSTIQGSHHLLFKQGIVCVCVVTLFGTIGWFLDSYWRPPTVDAATISGNPQSAGLQDSITIRLDRPVNRQKVSITADPPIEGDLSFSDPYIERYFERTIHFTPTTPLRPDTTYTVTIHHLSNVTGSRESEYVYHFHTAGIAAISSSIPTAQQSNIGICAPIRLTLNEPLTPNTVFTFLLSPSVPLKSVLGSDRKTYTITPAECLSQGSIYNLTANRAVTVISANGEHHPDDSLDQQFSLTFTTKGAPGIAGFTPQGSQVLINTSSLSLAFTEDMAEQASDSLIQITPTLPGQWKWKDKRTLTFSPAQDLQYATKYTVAIAQGLQDTQHGFIGKEASYSFTTIGPARVISLTPSRGSTGISPHQSIKITFDQNVDHTSAQEHFSISPSVANGSFSWSGQTLIYSGNMNQDSTYTVTMQAGVHSLAGQDSTQTATTTFATQESTTLLAIAQDYQDYPLSCEVASLKMALAFKGVRVAESQLLQAMNTDPAPRAGNIWGNPNLAFVGDVNGKQDTTGYGVYAGPIVQVGSQYRQTQAYYGWSVSSLVDQIANGNSVVVWGTAGSASADTWSTPDGQTIHGYKGEHVRLVVGFTGPQSHPSSLIINDPIFGRLRWSISQFDTNWSTLGRMAVVVY